MKIVLLENQIDLILRSLESYSSETDKKQLLYSTYESILSQKISSKSSKSTDSCCNENVTQM